MFQEFYLRRARSIFVTAAIAGLRPLRVVPVSIVVVDEVSQIKEIEVLNATVRHLTNRLLKKIAYFNDQAQLGPYFQRHEHSEFGGSMTKSLLNRLIESKFPYYMLTAQRRMHPDIGDLVNSNFYQVACEQASLPSIIQKRGSSEIGHATNGTSITANQYG